MFFAFAVLMVGAVHLRKHRLFSDARVDDMRRLEIELRKMGNVWPIGFTTPEAIQHVELYPDISRGWMDRGSGTLAFVRFGCFGCYFSTSQCLNEPLMPVDEIPIRS